MRGDLCLWTKEVVFVEAHEIAWDLVLNSFDEAGVAVLVADEECHTVIAVKEELIGSSNETRLQVPQIHLVPGHQVIPGRHHVHQIGDGL